MQAAKKQRATFFNAIQRVADSVAEEAAVQAMSLERASTKLAHLERQWEGALQHQGAVMGLLADDNNANAEEQGFIVAEEQMLQAKEVLQARINIIQAQQVANAPPPPPPPAPQEVVLRHRREPTITKFDGKQQSWQAFYDLFRVEVHEREDIDDLQKMVLLSGACECEDAKAALGDWPVTANNYPEAWRLLQEKYSDVYVSQTAILDSVYHMPRQRSETADGLRMLQNVPRLAMSQLRALDVPTQHWDLWVMQTILHRAHEDTVEAWESQRDPDVPPTLQHLYTWLERRAKGRLVIEAKATLKKQYLDRRQKGKEKDKGSEHKFKEAISDDSKSSDGWRKGHERNNDRSSKFNHKGKAREHDSNQQSSRAIDVRNFKCWVCEQPHSMFDCPIVMAKGLGERKRLLQEKGICLQCGRPHRGNCRSPRDCNLCKGQAHSDLVCPLRVKKEKPAIAAVNVEPQQLAIDIE